ncbi:MAG TPA: SDR family oxidoreductase [Methylomusa anaerophila]|uniref:3-oxoacyl-[acyl-carrier-protein] reductase FabG n=1 Tax=Methylomusa anaerophila TaxID=1930071 RepID=A0A348AMB5_9FIRM|nr:SDR family oxidoreductase [Methylomusa anaerophila]BBB92213.1 3-oxoacyl-[acyl-carrier-protein] reductase FabG [Methylomusa anaerophila]HML87774.1 SDR family oxidoreductase [Methylomusa anaerophila]
MGILEGRTALVVGASSGVGYGCALRFAEEGANVLACARRLDRLGQLAREAEGMSGKIMPTTCDIAKEEDLDKVVAETIKEFGKIEILACIAQGGLEHPTHLLETKPELALESYVTGPLYTMLLMQKCFSYMKERHYGRIITCASGSAVSGTPGFAGYAMAKGAIMSLTRFAAKEWGQFGITTNCFLPVIKSEGFAQSLQGQEAEAMVKKISPVGYFGDAYKDCGPIVAFMASEGSHYMNGQMIGICGGIQIIA